MDLYEAYAKDVDGRLWTYIPNGPWENPEEALKPFIEAIENAGTIQAYTVHRPNKDTGMKDVELQFRKPGSYTTPSTGRSNND